MSHAKDAKPDRTQAARFREAARDLGADESEERFNEALRKVGKAKPKANEGAPHRRSQPEKGEG